jgi:hypothetical protein
MSGANVTGKTRVSQRRECAGVLAWTVRPPT